MLAAAPVIVPLLQFLAKHGRLISRKTVVVLVLLLVRNRFSLQGFDTALPEHVLHDFRVRQRFPLRSVLR